MDVAETYVQSGHEKWEQKDFKGAIEDYIRAAELASYVYPMWNCLLQQEVEWKEEQFIRIIDICTEIISNNTQDIHTILFRGIAKDETYNRFRNKTILNEAIEDYSRAIEINPNLSNSYFFRGYAKEFYLHLYKEAIEDYNLAIKVDNNNAHYYSCLAEAKEKIKDFDGAIQDYLKLIEFRPIYYVCLKLAKIYYNQKEYDQALEYVNKAIEINPDDYSLAQELKEVILLKNIEQIELIEDDFSLKLRLIPSRIAVDSS